MGSIYIVFGCFLAGCFLATPNEARYIKRSATDSPHLCSRSTPCGWEVYRPFIRTIDYFIKSPCECPAGNHCIRTSDDISISAYVHRCRPLDEDGHEWPFESFTSTSQGSSSGQ